MLIWSIISWIVFFLPTLYCNILKRRVTVVARYVYLTVLVVHAGIQVAFLTYHTIIMLLFPLVVSCLYNKKCYVKYTVMLSIPMIWVGHILSKFWCIVPNEPLYTMRQILLHGALPRTIEFVAIVVICRYISDRIEELLDTLGDKNNELYEDQEKLILVKS